MMRYTNRRLHYRYFTLLYFPLLPFPSPSSSSYLSLFLPFPLLPLLIFSKYCLNCIPQRTPPSSLLLITRLQQHSLGGATIHIPLFSQNLALIMLYLYRSLSYTFYALNYICQGAPPSTVWTVVYLLHSGHVMPFGILFYCSCFNLVPTKGPIFPPGPDRLSHLVTAE